MRVAEQSCRRRKKLYLQHLSCLNTPLKHFNFIQFLETTPSTAHCEIFGSNLQQPHQHHVFRAYFEAEANKWQRIFCLIYWSKLTDSVVKDDTSMPCSARQTRGQWWSGWYVFLILVALEIFHHFFCIWLDHLLWLCVSRAVCL